MKRFLCRICKKYIRVRVLPPDVDQTLINRVKPGSPVPEGTCRWHDTEQPRSKQHIGYHLGSTRRVSAASAKSKSKKG